MASATELLEQTKGQYVKTAEVLQSKSKPLISLQRNHSILRNEKTGSNAAALTRSFTLQSQPIAYRSRQRTRARASSTFFSQIGLSSSVFHAEIAPHSPTKTATQSSSFLHNNFQHQNGESEFDSISAIITKRKFAKDEHTQTPTLPNEHLAEEDRNDSLFYDDNIIEKNARILTWLRSINQLQMENENCYYIHTNTINNNNNNNNHQLSPHQYNHEDFPGETIV